jgi:Glycosyltransferase family 87
MAGEANSAQSPREFDPLQKALTHSLAFWAVVAPVWVLVGAAMNHRLALDFHHAFLPAAHAVLHGTTPYSTIGSHALADGTAFLYPPLTAYLLVPFTVFPPLAGEILAVLLVAATVPATLLVLGVRDWRCHACALLWWPVLIGIQTANVTLPLVLGLALVWRYRDRRLVTALLTGLVIAVKLVFWPLLVWLVATRRYRTAALAAAASAVLVLVPWAGIGFAGLHGYRQMLSSVSGREGPRGYSLAALLHYVLPSWSTATAVETAVGGAILLVVLVWGRRGRDRDAMALTVVAILVLTPLVEMHYLALLLVVVGLYRRRLDAAWVAPLFIWGASANGAGGLVAQNLHVLAVVAVTLILAMSDWRPPRRRTAMSAAPCLTGSPSPSSPA